MHCLLRGFQMQPTLKLVKTSITKPAQIDERTPDPCRGMRGPLEPAVAGGPAWEHRHFGSQPRGICRCAGKSAIVHHLVSLHAVAR